MRINHLSESVDVYSDWIDHCDDQNLRVEAVEGQPGDSPEDPGQSSHQRGRSQPPSADDNQGDDRSVSGGSDDDDDDGRPSKKFKAHGKKVEHVKKAAPAPLNKKKTQKRLRKAASSSSEGEESDISS
eukprot:GHVR01009450.1.p1 GENE.GHVR01009450.1~~GHVR01009450.1.p1  ORF type:complete len:128 (+),score=42.05 GHVR01009450.1:260-643(+)